MCDSGLAAAAGSTLPAYNSAGWLTVRFMLLSVRGVFVLAFMAAGTFCTEYRRAHLAQVWANLCPFQVLP